MGLLNQPQNSNPKNVNNQGFGLLQESDDAVSLDLRFRRQSMVMDGIPGSLKNMLRFFWGDRWVEFH